MDFDKIESDDRRQRNALTKAMRTYAAGHSAAEAVRKVLRATGCFSVAQIPADHIPVAIRAVGGEVPAEDGFPEWPRLASVDDLDTAAIYAKWNGGGGRRKQEP